MRRRLLSLLIPFPLSRAEEEGLGSEISPSSSLSSDDCAPSFLLDAMTAILGGLTTSVAFFLPFKVVVDVNEPVDGAAPFLPPVALDRGAELDVDELVSSTGDAGGSGLADLLLPLPIPIPSPSRPEPEVPSAEDA